MEHGVRNYALFLYLVFPPVNKILSGASNGPDMTRAMAR